jgi:hypothetical protein
VDTVRAVHEDLARDGVRLVLAAMPAAALDQARGSEWFAEQEQAGLVQPTVEEAIAQARRDQPA